MMKSAAATAFLVALAIFGFEGLVRRVLRPRPSVPHWRRKNGRRWVRA